MTLTACSGALRSTPPCPSDPPQRAQVLVAQVEQVPPEVFDLAGIDAYLQMQTEQMGFVGLSVGIMRRGEVVFAKGYGQRSLEPAAPVDELTQFAMASNTKQFTCVSALLLEQEGKLALTDTVATHYPELTRAADIRLLDLLQHTSGYPDFYPLDFVVSPMAKAAQTEDLVRQYASLPLDFEPRSRWSYSNTGYLIVGRVIERLSDQSFADFMQTRIFDALGMSDSMVGAVSPSPSAATGYVSFALGDPEPAVREGPGWLHAAGGLWSTPRDMLRWDLALMDGELLEPRSWALMTTPATLSDGRVTTYGCGIGISRVHGEQVLSHGGAIDGFLSRNTMIPRTRSALVVATNGYFVDPGPLIEDLLGLLIEAEQTQLGAPVIDGPPATQVAVELLREMQAGTIDRSRLSDEFSLFMSEARLQQAAARLAALGEPVAVELEHAGERGGMESASVRLVFAGEVVVTARLFRAPDGTIHQFILQR
ncbi:serine hydrolase domain-containing protein [Enhygromyxa salina]|nr:serine hydrolase domain-containing protein [Enhygromyxa salina]